MMTTGPGDGPAAPTDVRRPPAAATFIGRPFCFFTFSRVIKKFKPKNTFKGGNPARPDRARVPPAHPGQLGKSATLILNPSLTRRGNVPVGRACPVPIRKKVFKIFKIRPSTDGRRTVLFHCILVILSGPIIQIYFCSALSSPPEP